MAFLVFIVQYQYVMNYNKIGAIRQKIVVKSQAQINKDNYFN